MATLVQPVDLTSTLLPLVYPSINGSFSFCKKSLKCINGSGVLKGEEVERAGGAAMILMNYEIDGFSTEAEQNHRINKLK